MTIYFLFALASYVVYLTFLRERSQWVTIPSVTYKPMLEHHQMIIFLFSHHLVSLHPSSGLCARQMYDLDMVSILSVS